MSESSTSRLPVWLIVSLIANALLIGLLIGGGLGQRKAGPPPASIGGEQALMRGLDQALPASERRDVRQAFRRAFAESRDERKQLRDARRELTRLFANEPYDAEAVQTALADMRAADDAMKAKMHDLLAEQLGKLSVEQRRALIRDLSRDGRSDRRGGRDRQSPDERRFRDRD